MNNRQRVIALLLFTIICSAFSFNKSEEKSQYKQLYFQKMVLLEQSLKELTVTINQCEVINKSTRPIICKQIEQCKQKLKAVDFWLRYLEPVLYRKINGPLPVEWETEVFEKFEKPYKRNGAGLSLAWQYLQNENINKDSLFALIQSAANALSVYKSDSITRTLNSFDHFFLCNRLYLLNLAAIYTTGFECPDNSLIVTELKSMMTDVSEVYNAYNTSWPGQPLTNDYFELYNRALIFVQEQPNSFDQFDHFSFISNYINPLFAINQKLIGNYHVISRSYNDFSLNDNSPSIFSKQLYHGQNAKGAYYMIEDEKVLNEIKKTGKLLFYDPLLSQNNQRSCASCHKPNEFFTDTSSTTALMFNKQGRLPRNTPTLLNVAFNHLVMLDGKHFSLQDQAKDVTGNAIEMGSNQKDILKKILSCKEYKTAFTRYLKYTKIENEITFTQVVSAITLYYSSFGNYDSQFDEAMNRKAALPADVIKGFNLFMGKAQCGTCHFVPQFNGVKPPYISSEFEVLGTPQDTLFKQLSSDSGRYLINPAPEMMNAFRTVSLRNVSCTQPYAHNGVFKTLEQVIDFYDSGGGAGKGLNVPNQTLPVDSLRLTSDEKKSLILFMKSLTEKISFDDPPPSLPESSFKELNLRIPGGVY